jgi:hypothetical protein
VVSKITHKPKNNQSQSEELIMAKLFNIKVSEIKIADYTIKGFSLGEVGRGRKIITIPCPENQVEFMEPGLTKSGKPRLNNSKSDKGWIARISSEGAYVRGANGNVSYPPQLEGKINLIAKGYGAFGAAGRTGAWDDVLIHTELENFLIRVKPSRGDAYILLFKDSNANKLTYDQADALDIYYGESSCSSRGDWIRF